MAPILEQIDTSSNDYYRISSIMSLVDGCIGNEILRSSERVSGLITFVSLDFCNKLISMFITLQSMAAFIFRNLPLELIHVQASQ